MPYVRRRGNHLAIVHGARHPQTGSVEQHVLMTLHSKAEALAATGRTSNGEGRAFRAQMEDRFPEIRFSWNKINAAIGELQDQLPDLAKSRQDRVFGGFAEALDTLTRQIIAADPQSLDSARELLEAHRTEVQWLSELIKRRLDAAEQTERSKWSRDTFGWRLALSAGTMDPELEEELADHLDRGDLDQGERLFRFVVRLYPDYAEGWNYLGLVALRRGDLEQALELFESCEAIGRRLFPKRIAKKDYWARLETRPYMRGLRNQWIVLNRLGRHARALEIAARLDRECGDHITAAVYRSTTYLNTGEWKLAFEAASYTTGVYPEQSLVAAFALFELGEPDEARARFVQAMLEQPRCVGITLGKRTPTPCNAIEASDHNNGVSFIDNLAPYLRSRSPRAKTFFTRLWNDDELKTRRQQVIETGRAFPAGAPGR